MTCLVQAYQRTDRRDGAPLFLVAVHRISWLGGLRARFEREFGTRAQAKPYANVIEALADIDKAPLSKARVNEWPVVVVSR